MLEVQKATPYTLTFFNRLKVPLVTMSSAPHPSFEAPRPASVVPFERCVPSELFSTIGLTADEFERVQKLILLRRPVKKGQTLFQGGQKFIEVFAVRYGSFRSGLLSLGGDLRVTAFHLQGDIMGFDGIATQHHVCEAQALEDSEVCAMPFEQVATLSRELRPVQRLFLQMMSKELVRDNAVLVMLGSLNADERVAAFLLNLLDRMKARGFSASELQLPMGRHDIASFLGLKNETVSRAFASLNERGLVKLKHRSVAVLQPDALARLAQVARAKAPVHSLA